LAELARPPAEGPLEWQVIIVALQRRTVTSMGRELLAGLGPLADRAEVERALASIEELRELKRDDALPRLSGVEAIHDLLTRAEKDGALEAEELMAVGRTLDAIAGAAQALDRVAARAPQVHARCGELGDHLPLARAIGRTFDAQGRIEDHASAELADLRRRTSRLREEIKSRLGELLIDYGRAEVLQETYFTLRGDRYVVPVRSDRRGEVNGLVHDTSQSGQTLFIEPQPLIDLGNRLKIAEAEVQEEERRILRKLTARLVEHCPQLRADLDRVAELDSFIARARLADDLQAEVPQLCDEPLLDLRQARHPSLVLATREAQKADAEPRKMVANDIAIGGEGQVLVVSGPNAGGKTVALKTAGLCALMIRAGLPIPAFGTSRIGLFPAVHAVIGDAQSIDAQLSTFSAHVLAIDRVVHDVTAATAGPSRVPTLCLIDEITQGTDPNQGACLAQAFLEALADQGALAIATTHHQRLKALALDDRRFRNASVVLDPETLRPTFELHLDVPGASSAFAIAAALGVAGPLIDRARALAGPEASRLEVHISQLAEEREKLARARGALEASQAEAEAERLRLESARGALHEREQQLRHEARESLLGDVRRARRDVAEIIAELQRGGRSLPKADAAAHALKAVEARVAARIETGSEAEPALERVVVGARVLVTRLGQEGEVVSVDRDGGCEVQVGALRTRARVDELAPPRTSQKQTRKARRREERSSRDEDSSGSFEIAAKRGSPRSSRNTLDLRGQRVEEALENIDRFLDELSLRGDDRAFLLHGHGTGALRRALRAELPASPYAQQVRAADEDEGGDAFTVVELA